MAGSLALLMYWAILTTLCSALRSKAKRLQYQAVMQRVRKPIKCAVLSHNTMLQSFEDVLRKRAIGMLTAGMSTRDPYTYSWICPRSSMACILTRHVTHWAFLGCSGFTCTTVCFSSHGTIFHRPQSTAWSTLCEGDVSRCIRQIAVTPDSDWLSDPGPYLF